MLTDSLIYGAVLITFIIIPIIIDYVYDCKYKRKEKRNARREREANSQHTNDIRVIRVRDDYEPIGLNEIRIENNSRTRKNRFNIITGKEEEFIAKERNCVFFIDSCIIQAKYQTLSSESMYYEIELLDFSESFELLFGYADKSGSKIHELHILLNNKIYGVNVDNKLYPNTFVHTLKQGDIIGCFYDLSSNEITFTYNGSDLCYYQFHSTVMYPTIYSTKGTLLKYNLGDQPFHYRRANQLKLGLDCNYIQELPPSY